MDQLKKRGRHLANRCPLCGKEEGNIDHLLLPALIVVQDLVALLFTIFGANWVLPSSVKDTLEGWKGCFVRKKLENYGWQLLFACFGYCGGKETRLFLMMWCFQSKE